MEEATKRLWYWLDAVDASCNRFRDDSELSRLNDSHGATMAISPTLELALEAALLTADVTGDMVDPTVLPALLALGYDRDFDELAHGDSIRELASVPSMGPSSIHSTSTSTPSRLTRPCQLDLGASAKALVADLIADDVAPSAAWSWNSAAMSPCARRTGGALGDLGERRARPPR